jgi:hypothetical protein
MTRTADPGARPPAAEGAPWALPQTAEGDQETFGPERGQTAVTRLIRRTP